MGHSGTETDSPEFKMEADDGFPFSLSTIPPATNTSETESSSPDYEVPFTDWTEADEHFACMFHPWHDELPVAADADVNTVTSTLHKIECVIPPFEEAIRHSDKGFMEWRERHQKAMQAGITAIPGWPPLLHGNPPEWNNEEWNKRYGYLVHQRCKLVEIRMKQLGNYVSQGGIKDKIAAGADAVARVGTHSSPRKASRRLLPKY